MKLVRFGSAGSEKPGILDAEGVVRDLSAVVADIGGTILSDDGLARLRQIDIAQLPQVEGPVRFGPCVAGTGKFICIGLNYADHAAESGLSVPPEPVIFMKATSAFLEDELQAALGRGRYERPADGAKGHRNGHRERQVIGTFGSETVKVPRARMIDDAGHASEC